MANTTMTSRHRGKSVTEAMSNQLNAFYERFLEEHRNVFKEASLPLRVTLFGQPHDAIIAIDRSSVFFIASPGTATAALSTESCFDFSAQGTVAPQELMRSAAREHGWERMVSLQFSRGLLDAPADQQREEFRRVAEETVNGIRQRQETAGALGITEALTYLDNARARYDAGGAAGFSDCKANCRNAIISLMRGLAGTETIREAVKKLNKEGLLGKREAEVVEAIEDLIARLHGLASKTGTHPPLATEEDARFTLRLTEATVEYIVGLAGKAKGLQGAAAPQRSLK